MIDLDRERTLIRERVLGWALACPEILPKVDLGRDLELSLGPQGLDLARVQGMRCLAQALTIGLTSRLGEDVFNTEHGFDGLNALIDEPNPILARERIRIAVIRVLRQDPRVRRIIDVQLGDGRLESPIPGSRDLDIRVAFETVSGEQASVELGKAVTNV